MISTRTIQAREEAARADWRRNDWAAINVGDPERMASKVGGGVLLAFGLLRGGIKGLLTAGIGGALLYRGMTGHCSLYQAIGANTADPEPGPMNSVAAGHGVRVEDAVMISGKSPEEVYRFWRDYANLPRFMSHVASVTDLGQGRSRWTVKGPLGTTLRYIAVIHNETPGELIAWRSIGEGDLDTAGSVRFEAAPGARGTVVRINQKFAPPGGTFGIAVARVLGTDPWSQTKENLRNLKRLLESAEPAHPAG